MLIFASLIMGLANSTVQTLSQTILSQETPPHEQGEIMGINASYMSLGQIAGPIAGGSLALLSIHYPFLAGGLLICIATLISRKITLQKAAH